MVKYISNSNSPRVSDYITDIFIQYTHNKRVLPKNDAHIIFTDAALIKKPKCEFLNFYQKYKVITEVTALQALKRGTKMRAKNLFKIK